METFTGPEDYQKDFNPRDYLNLYYLSEVTGDTLIDIGSGPTIYQISAACERFTEITCTDYTDVNRQELECWLKNEPGAFDWREVLKMSCEIEGNREKCMEKQENLRRAIKYILKCDVTKSNPLDPVVQPPFDCLVTSLCLEAACRDIDTFRNALKHIISLVKPGGHLVMITVLQEMYYMVGKKKFSCLYLERSSVEEAVKETGCVIRHTDVHATAPNDTADCTAVLFLVARKK